MSVIDKEMKGVFVKGAFYGGVPGLVAVFRRFTLSPTPFGGTGVPIFDFYMVDTITGLPFPQERTELMKKVLLESLNDSPEFKEVLKLYGGRMMLK